MSRSLTLLAAVAAGAAPLCAAETATPVLKPVVVTATRTEQPAAAVLASVTVLTRADIERLQATNVGDLLARAAGVDFTRSGGPGAASTVYLRGSNGDHTLFLVDGQRIGSATTGTTDFQYLDPAQIERIEIVRGPRAALYGSDAIGGVIQIFTRRGGGKPNAYASAGYGSNASYKMAAGGSGQWQQWRYAAHLSHFFTEGINNTRSSRPPLNDDDAYRNSSVSFNLGYDFNGADGAKLDIDHLYARTMNEYDGTSVATQPYADGWLQNSKLTLRAPLTAYWSSTASIGRSINDADNFDKRNPRTHTDFRTLHNLASWQNDFSLGEQHTVSVGADYNKDRVTGSTAYRRADGTAATSRDNIGYFAQYLGRWGALDIQAGLRNDDNEDYGDKTTGNAALGIALPAQHRLMFAYGTAFKATTFNQLYYPGFGNPDLEPESSKNIEAELRGDYAQLNWSLSVFQNTIDNLIQNVTVAPGVSLPSNVQKARIRGGELQVDAKVAQWLLSGSLSYADPRDEQTDTVLVRRARRSLKLDADREFGAWAVGASWRLQDQRYANAANTQELGGYGLVDVRGSYRFSEAWQLQLKMTNLFAKKYQLVSGYETERFGWFATVTYRM